MPVPLPDPDVVPAPAPRPLRDPAPVDRGEGLAPDLGEGLAPGGEDVLDLERRGNEDGDFLDAPRVPGDTDGDGKYEPEIDPGNSDAFERRRDALDAIDDDLSAAGESGSGRRRRVRPASAAGAGRATLADATGTDATGAAPFVPADHAAADAPPVAALDTLCVVSLRNKSFAAAAPEHSAVHGGRTYFFSTAAARAAFVADPAEYAPAFCGMDPVAYLEDGGADRGGRPPPARRPVLPVRHRGELGDVPGGPGPVRPGLRATSSDVGCVQALPLRHTRE